MSSAKEKARLAREQLKAARASGKRDYQLKEAEDIYDEVNEEDYQQVVRGRLMEDDFVIDEGGASGYADHGMDDWDRQSSSDDEERESRKRAKKEEKAAAKAASTKALSAAAARRKAARPIIAPGANPYINPNKVKPGAALPEQEDDFMNNLLGGLEGKATVSKTESYKPTPPPSKYSSKPKQVARVGAIRASSSRDTIVSSSSASERSDGVSSDPFVGATTGPSSESDDVRDLDDHIGMIDFKAAPTNGDGDLDGDISMTVPKKEEEDDDDELFLKPAAPNAKGKGPAVRRQLVNGSSVKPVVPKPEPMDVELPLPPVTYAPSQAKPKGMDWRTATANLAVAALPALSSVNVDEEEDVLPVPESLQKGKKATALPLPVQHVNAQEEDGSLRFWWFDFVEPGNGLLILIGKVKAKGGKEDGRWVSACVVVTGIKRKLYVLPRQRALDSDGVELDEDGPPEFDDVEADFQVNAEENWGVENLNVTPGWVRRKYAFGTKGVPREETDWLEATCDFPSKDTGKIPLDASGERFSHVFGTTASPFELFVVERKIMGPCWLNLAAPKITKEGISWTKLEAEVHKDDVSVFAQDDPTAPKANPPLTIMSLSTRTVVHLTENKREVVCASTIDDPIPLEKQPSTVQTLVRPLFTPFPNGFEAAARSIKPEGARAPTLLPLRDEKALLTQLLGEFSSLCRILWISALTCALLAIIARHDPDLIVGNDFSALELDVLLNRLKDLKVDHWSRIGRMRRPKWPKLQATRNANLLSGRLILDLSSDGSKSMIESTTWSLTEMCSTHLKVDREDMDPEDTPKYFDNVHSTSAKLLHFVGHCEADCYFQMAIAYQVQALPLTRQLTNLAGNSWNKTLGGNRAERNEYILLHRFNERGYVCPDKISSWEKKATDAKVAKAAKAKAKEAGEEEVKVVASKAKFKGGMVMEPKKGLWDRFVLVMDYNSLYPSIIQEFDICFSTIDWTEDGMEEDEAMFERSPCDGDPVGVLPQLIASLVERRRNVKKLMKDRNVSPAKMLQYDITQKALKLTANSMYGCLGFEGSRFYARPLAALTTFKGREILTRTKTDAETLNLDVIYGDTDSVMINTDQTELSEAHRIGYEFKKLINDKYKKLEIDTDAVFACMLLLAKKKYAALKVEDDGSRTLEVKGLDMKRREWCELSKAASKNVLNEIMSAKPVEDVVNEVHEYLTNLAENIRAGRIPLDQFIIFKRLGKNPQDYPDAKSQPHVSVALKMKAKGQSAKAGDVIPYIFCVPEDGVPQTNAKAPNAYHPDDVRRSGSTLKIDFECYINTQILPPIERLCDPIEGTEKARLAECLGLDVARYKNVGNGDLPERDFKTLQSQQTDAERFALAEPFNVRCRACGSSSVFDGLENASKMLSSYGCFCPSPECSQPLAPASLAVQLDLQIRNFIAKFYEGWLVCDDASCMHRTRMMSVYGKRCLVAGCRGQMSFEYTDKMLYDQLLFFDTLFDVEKARSKASGTAAQDEVQRLGDGNSALLNHVLRPVVTKHLDKNGRRWVQMSGLFSFLNPKP